MSYPTYTDEAPQSAPRARRRARGLAVGAAIVAAGATISLALSGAIAAAEDVPATPTYTPTPSQTGGQQDPVNINDCSDIGLDNILKTGTAVDANDGNGNSGDVSDDLLSMTVTIAAGYTVDAIVVKGASAANIYASNPPFPITGPALVTGLVPPENPGEATAISHWLICGSGTGTTTEPDPCETVVIDVAAVDPAPVDTCDTDTSTESTPVTTSSTTPGLPTTGAALTGYLIAGVALIAGGVVTLLLVRRRRDAVTPSV